MKVGKAGRAGRHAAYIARQGEYADRLERGEKLEASEAGNMPAWAQAQPLEFWRAADAYERANGTTYREMEIALPRELNPGQRVELVREFVRQELGERHAYQWAIHVPTAADGGEQPHVHLMFSERQRDGIERDPQQYFRRYNAKAPERGGARKGYGASAGQTLTQTQRAAELRALRGRWQEVCNQHLERAGLTQRIDMRSHAERGTGLEPEAKQLPSQWRGQGRAQVIEFRQARRELVQARQALAWAVPDARAEVISLEAERQRREQAKQEKAEQAKQARREKAAQARAALRAELDRSMRESIERGARELERLQARPVEVPRPAPQVQPRQEVPREPSAAELTRAIERLRPAPVAELVAQDEAVQAAERAQQALERQVKSQQALEARAQQEAAQWREAHPVKAKAHDLGLFRSEYLGERETTAEEARQAWLMVAPSLQDAERAAKSARQEAEKRILVEQAPIRAHVAKLQAALGERLKRERTVRTFEALAAKRAGRARGWGDEGQEWQAVPERLREAIENYNQMPGQVQEAIRARLEQEPQPSRHLQEMLEQHQTLVRGRSRGLSR